MKKLSIKHCYLIIAVFTVAIFYNSLFNDFVFDDESVIQQNQGITELSNIPKFFSGAEGFHKVIGNYYRPVVFTTYALDYSIWNLNPFGYHLTNLLIHLIACLILFRILLILFSYSKFSLFIALLGTLVFSAHPVHTEAISWISGRTDSLFTLFFFAAFYFYLKIQLHSESENYRKNFILMLLFLTLGLLSKEMMITFPVVIFLFDALYSGSKHKFSFQMLKDRLPAYGAIIVITIAYVFERHNALSGVSDRPNYLYFAGQDQMTVLATMLKTVPVYLRLLIVPVNLLYHYNGVIPDSHSIADFKVILSIVFILCMVVTGFILANKFPPVSFAIFLFLVTLLPVMNIVPTMNLMAERFLYLPSFAIIIVLCYFTARVIDQKSFRRILSFYLSLIIVLSYMTINRNAEWKNNDTLYNTANNVDGTVLLVNSGNIFANKKNYDEALTRYKRSIMIRDNNVLAHHNSGLVYFLRNQYDSATVEFNKALAVDSLFPDGYQMLANVYEIQGKYNDELASLEKLNRNFPGYKDADKRIAEINLKKDSLQSIPTSKLPGEIDQSAILEKRSFNLYNDKKYKEAISDLNELIKLNPKLKAGYENNIAMCYKEMNDLKNAEVYFQRSKADDPASLNSYSGLIEVFIAQNNKQKAIEACKDLLQKFPDNTFAKQKLDSLSK